MAEDANRGSGVTDETIDEALSAMEGKAAVYAGYGYPDLDNHGPMMAEALVALGRPDAVMPWVENYVRGLPDAPSPQKRIVDWRGALGDGERYGDWQQLFRNELKERPWHEVVGDWVGRLLPGLASAGAHGVIRVAHAVRSLTTRSTQERLGELADALATWAAHFYELPSPVTALGRMGPAQAVDHIPLAPPGEGTTGMRLRVLETFAPFRSLQAPFMAAQEPDHFLADVMTAFARAFAATADLTPARATGLVHSVTVPAAVRLLVPYLRTEDREEACLGAWRTAAGIRAGYASPSRVPLREQPSGERAELIERAVALEHVHAVKFVEACWRAHDIDESDVLPVAAARAVEIYEAQAS